MFCGDNILVEKINKLITNALMSDSYECYKEVGPLLGGVARERVTEQETFKLRLQ